MGGDGKGRAWFRRRVGFNHAPVWGDHVQYMQLLYIACSTTPPYGGDADFDINVLRDLFQSTPRMATEAVASVTLHCSFNPRPVWGRRPL